jgi:hypothetical protein
VPPSRRWTARLRWAIAMVTVVVVALKALGLVVDRGVAVNNVGATQQTLVLIQTHCAMTLSGLGVLLLLLLLLLPLELLWALCAQRAATTELEACFQACSSKRQRTTAVAVTACPKHCK